MNERLSIEESAFTADNIPEGQQILDKETELGKKRTCVNGETIVFVSLVTTELLAALVAAVMFVSITSEWNGKSNVHQISALVAVQLVIALIAHSLALLAICRSLGHVLLVACGLNLVEVLLNVTRLCWAGNSAFADGEKLPETVRLIIEMLCDLLLMALKILYHRKLRKNE